MRVLAVLFSIIATALAQRISIGAPVAGETLTVGQNTIVSIIKGDTLSSSTEIGIAILLHHCTQNPCEDASQKLGSVLYSGPFNPQPGSSFDGEPFQNFTVTVPSGFLSGPAVLSVPHASLIGAGPELFSEIANVTVNID